MIFYVNNCIYSAYDGKGHCGNLFFTFFNFKAVPQPNMKSYYFCRRSYLRRVYLNLNSDNLVWKNTILKQFHIVCYQDINLINVLLLDTRQISHCWKKYIVTPSNKRGEKKCQLPRGLTSTAFRIIDVGLCQHTIKKDSLSIRKRFSLSLAIYIDRLSKRKWKSWKIICLCLYQKEHPNSDH